MRTGTKTLAVVIGIVAFSAFGSASPRLQSFSLFVPTVFGGTDVNFQISLNELAPVNTVSVRVRSSNPLLVPDGFVKFCDVQDSSGASQSVGVAMPVNVSFVASLGGVSRSAVVTLVPCVLSDVREAQCHFYIRKGAPVQMSIQMVGFVPPGGAHIRISSSNPALIPVVADQFLASRDNLIVDLQPGIVTTQTPVTLRATFKGVTKAFQVIILPY